MPLTSRGKLQAAAVRKYLQDEKLGAVHSSDLQRARETAQIIAEPHGLQVQENASWRELDFGDWNGCGERELLAELAGIVGAASRESAGSARARWRKFARFAGAYAARVADGRRANSHPHAENVALVTHQNMIRVIICEILRAPLESYRALHIGNASVSRVEINDGSVALGSVNEVAHLSAIN